eukprot:jgi/Tetstr1/423056/TSEL_013827.t1
MRGCVVAFVHADDPVVLNRALKWKYLLLMAPGRGGRRWQQALAWRFRAFAERRKTELVRSWDDPRTEALYAECARQRRTDAELFVALFVGTGDTVVALAEYGQLSRAAGRLSSNASSGPTAVRAMSEVTSMYLQGRLSGWFNRLFASASLVALVKKLGEGGALDVRIVHTDLRSNAYNKAWRRTTIQRHIDCSSLHLVIPALLASLWDSFLLMDARTLEVTYGAARFNADDKYLMGLLEHVYCWPALHAFRTSIKACLGLELRVDSKMHAYNADMEAARRQAPADILVALDSHRATASRSWLNVPLGSPWYVQVYMRG